MPQTVTQPETRTADSARDLAATAIDTKLGTMFPEWEHDQRSSIAAELSLAASAPFDAELNHLRNALVRISLKDRHTRRVNAKPDGGLRGVGGMIACFALTGINGSYLTDAAILAAYPDAQVSA